ncbi:MAG: tetratricopeptide repeat protein, partial [Magnetovibrio sp.]|nr:tetratricopeptide repeat protein [Magnetovibrio sp.]
LGDLLRRHERWPEAIDAYAAAIERVGTLSKRNWRLLYSRGIALERAKRWPEAEKDFLKALEFEPDQPYVLNYLGYSWVDRGVHLERALEMIHNAVRRRPNDGYIIDSLGWVYYRLGNYPKAVLELERAVQIRPEDPVINDHLGDAYWRVGRELEARFQWQRSLSLDPDEKVEAEVLKKLKSGLPPAKPVGVPDAAGQSADPDKT